LASDSGVAGLIWAPWLQNVYSVLVVEPLARVYLFGPSFLGGWTGKSPEDISKKKQ